MSPSGESLAFLPARVGARRRGTWLGALGLTLAVAWAAGVWWWPGADRAQSLGIWTMVGSVLGRIDVECAPYVVLERLEGIEIRRYSPGVAAEVAMTSDENEEPFRLLAQYIGVFGSPANRAAATIAMTAPVLTQGPEHIAMTAPVLTAARGARSTMQFVLPSKYTDVSRAPRPLDPRVHLVSLPSRLLAVQQFTGLTSSADTSKRAASIATTVQQFGYRVAQGDGQVPRAMLARFNPPWTLPWLRRNEVQVLLVETKGRGR